MKLTWITCTLVVLLGDSLAQQQDKWVWGTERRAKLSRGINGRYGVFEETEDVYRPGFQPPVNLPPLVRPPISHIDRFPQEGREDRPYRPNRPFRPDRPEIPERPFVGGIRPNEHLPTPPPLFGRPPRPHPNEDSGINDPTKFRSCKCAHAFNCKSPGIAFGSCDVGKKYCCEKFDGSFGVGHPANDDDGPIPEVLAGPGGPVDHLPEQYRKGPGASIPRKA